jgi:nucleotide-binding universal stress UspA family protein
MRLLTGVDLRLPGHEWILEPATYLATRVGGRIDLMFVLSGAESARVAVHLERMKELMASLPEEMRGDCMVEPGDVVDVLVEKGNAYDIIVVGPREPGPIERMLRGSIASRVVRNSSKPVYIPRSDNHRTEVAKCLLGLDLNGAHTNTLVELAGRWTKRVGGVLDALWVEPQRLPYIADSVVRAKAKRDWEAARQPDRARVEQLMRDNVLDEHRGDALIDAGEAEMALIDLSASYDIVIIGSLERPGIAGFLLGSVADNVVRQAQCDVLALTAHPTAHAD